MADDVFGHLPDANPDVFSHLPDGGGVQAAKTPAAPEEPSAALDVARQIPLGFNRGFDALYNLPNTLVNYGANKLGYEGNLINPVKLATRFNPEDDTAKTTAGRYAGALGEQLGASVLPVGGTVSRGAALMPAVKNALSAAAGSSAAGQTAKEAGLGPGWQLGAALAGGLAAPGAVNSALYRGPVDPRTAERTLAAQAAQQEGISVPKAAVAGSVEKPLAGRLASLPIVGAPLQNAARTSLDQTGQRVADIADLYGTGNRATAGAGVRDAIAEYIETGSAAPINRLYNRVDALVDDTVQNPLTETHKVVQRLLSVPSETAKAVNQRAVDVIADDLADPNGLTYSGIKQMRTTVASMLQDKLRPDAGTTYGPLKALYGSLTADLKNAVKNAGQPGATQAFEQANAMNALAEARRDALYKIVGKSGGNSPEATFDNIINMARNTGKSANLEALTRARRSVDLQTWDDMSSAFVRRMGLNPKTGDFSPDRFLTEYGKLSPEGKQLLFNSTGRGDLSNSLDNLARVSQQFSEFYRMGNPSGTAGATWLAGLFGGGYGIGGLPTALPGVASMWGMSKYFASPANVDRMTRTLQARLAYVRNPNPSTEQRLALATSELAQNLKDNGIDVNAKQPAATKPLPEGYDRDRVLKEAREKIEANHGHPRVRDAVYARLSGLGIDPRTLAGQ